MKGSKMRESRSRTPLSKQKNRKKSEPEHGDVNPYLPPWPEWSDVDLNFERWDVRSSMPSFSSKRSSYGVQLRFEDPMGHVPLPTSLIPESWRRLFHIPGMQVFNETLADAPTLDLAMANAHLLHSEVMRWIVAGIMNLYQLGRAHDLELEGEGQAFSLPSKPWKPWHHIYAMCKVGKGTTHKPAVNPSGKYCIRLFYMGCWRRLTVDDYLPLDSEKRPLLPMSSSCREMWPALLSKALLKVAALSWTEHREIQDFSVMACLTGWYAQELSLYKVPPRSIWWLCQKLLMSNCENPEERFTGVKDVSVSVAYEPASWTSREPVICPSLRSTNTDPDAEVLGPVVLCAVMDTFPTELLPCEEHPVLLTRVRVNPSDERPPTPLWKTFRWKDWAIKQGLIKADKYVKFIRMYSALQKCQPDMSLGARIPSLTEVSLTKLETAASRYSKVKRRESKAAEKPASKEDSKVKRRESKAAEKPNGKEDKKIIQIVKKENQSEEENLLPEFWIEFEKIVHGVKRFVIFYKTKSFEHNIQVNDITQLVQENVPPATQSNKTGLKDHPPPPTPTHETPTTNCANLKRGRADALYFLMDSVASKKLLISLSVLNPNCCSLPAANLHGSRINKRKGSHESHISISSHGTKSHDTVPYDTNSHDPKTQPTLPPTYYIIGERYFWQSNRIHDMSFTVKTAATTCHLLQLKEGLRVYRLWLRLPETYAIRISSQTPFILGTRDRIQEVLVEESLSWKYYGLNFSNAFNTLINIERDSEIHQELLENMRKAYLPIHIPKPSSKFAAVLRRDIHARFEKTLMKLLVEITENSETIAQVVSEWRWLFHKGKFGSNIRLETKSGEVLEIRESLLLVASERYTSQIVLSRSVLGSENQLGSYRYCDSIDAIIPLKGDHTKLITFDQQTGIEFIRRMLGNDPDLLRYYPFRTDDYHHICFTDYKGVIRNSTEEWVPLARFVVHAHSITNPFCGIYLTSSFGDDVILVVNNDNLEQVPRFCGDIEPSYFFPNRRGYTVLAYGLGNGQKQNEHNWKIRIVSVPQQQLPHPCSRSSTKECSPEEPPELECKELAGHYMPNTENIIFKCLLTIEKSLDLTLRTVMSNNNVEFVLKISAGDEDVIKEYFATGGIIIPVVQLKGKDSGGPDFYVIEAQVLSKSWTLSPEEMEIVDTLRDKVRQELLVFAAEEGSRTAVSTPKPLPKDFTQRLKRNKKKMAPIEFEPPPPQPPPDPKRDLIPNAPYWILILVVEKDNSSTVVLEKDERRAEEIRKIKAQWEAADPGRYHKSLQIRKEFLEQDRYSAYLRDFIHEQGVETGEKTKYLLEHLSFREGDHEPHLAEVDQNDQRRKLVEEFDNEYTDIVMQFNSISKKQLQRRWAITKHLAKATNESKNLMAEAYYGRMLAVENVIKQKEKLNRLRAMEAKARKATPTPPKKATPTPPKKTTPTPPKKTRQSSKKSI